MKAPAAGTKSFKLLFDDSGTRPRQTKDISVVPTKSISQNLFRGKSTSTQSDDELEDENSRMKTITTNAKRSTKHIPNQASNNAPNAVQSEMRKSAKRSQPDTDTGYEAGDISNELPAKGPSLLPPSPPGLDSMAYPTKQANKRPGANTTSRKKPKMANELDEMEDDEDDGSDDLNANVKIVKRTQPRFERGPNVTDDLDFDSDPIFGRAIPRGKVLSQAIEPEIKRSEFEVDLPDKLRQVLALESSNTRTFQTESVVKSLLYGRRASNYDPVKGGEIWDVGEDDGQRDGSEEMQRDAEGEDDWEGEPIPWEVGEL
jgi:hypothetical protein